MGILEDRCGINMGHLLGSRIAKRNRRPGIPVRWKIVASKLVEIPTHEDFDLGFAQSTVHPRYT